MVGARVALPGTDRPWDRSWHMGKSVREIEINWAFNDDLMVIEWDLMVI